MQGRQEGDVGVDRKRFLFPEDRRKTPPKQTVLPRCGAAGLQRIEFWCRFHSAAANLPRGVLQICFPSAPAALRAACPSPAHTHTNTALPAPPLEMCV